MYTHIIFCLALVKNIIYFLHSVLSAILDIPHYAGHASAHAAYGNNSFYWCFSATVCTQCFKSKHREVAMPPSVAIQQSVVFTYLDMQCRLTRGRLLKADAFVIVQAVELGGTCAMACKKQLLPEFTPNSNLD